MGSEEEGGGTAVRRKGCERVWGQGKGRYETEGRGKEVRELGEGGGVYGRERGDIGGGGEGDKEMGGVGG